MLGILKKICIKCVGVVVFFYMAGCLWIFFYQQDLIFLPAQQMRSFPQDTNLQEVTLPTPDGVLLNAWYVDNKSRTTVLFFHGNAGNISYNQERLTLFNTLGVNALMVDYRGYGKSSGKIQNENDIYIDGETAYQYILAKGVQPQDIIIWGQSLGGAVAVHTAQSKPIRRTIIESTFTSLDDIASQVYWFIPTRWLIAFHFDNISKISNITSPILMIHSSDDEMFSIDNSRKLFDRIQSPKEFLETSGYHNGGFSQSYILYKENLEKFLNIK